jgi:hypothetical protein
MKQILLMVFGLLVIAKTAVAGEIFSEVPESPDLSQKYVFYLHGSGIEKQGVFGASENYREILKALASQGVKVISEAREEGTKFHAYGAKIARDVRKLVKAGVPMRNITVAGYSKGGRIALRTAAILSEPEVNYVILAGCLASHKNWHEKFVRKYAEDLQGHILSIYDEDDNDFSSCEPYFSVADGEVEKKELRLSTGLGHQLFHSPTAVWLEPLVNWSVSRANQ